VYNEGNPFNISECKKNDGLGRIRTGDLRHVKTGGLPLEKAFSYSLDYFLAAYFSTK
jgi:hypothetical protein